jgi:hypothetical protein
MFFAHVFGFYGSESKALVQNFQFLFSCRISVSFRVSKYRCWDELYVSTWHSLLFWASINDRYRKAYRASPWDALHLWKIHDRLSRSGYGIRLFEFGERWSLLMHCNFHKVKGSESSYLLDEIITVTDYYRTVSRWSNLKRSFGYYVKR